MEYDAFISDYETAARVKRSDAISVEIESYLGFKTGDVMDFGCGTGLVAFKLRNKVNKLFLMDSSKEMIQAVNHKLSSKTESNITTFTGDIFETDIDQKFDVIYASLVLHHTQDVQVAVNKLASYLKQNGKLIIIDLLPDNGNFHAEHENFEGHHGFKINNMTQILEEAGLIEVMGRKFFSSYQRVNDSNHPYSLFSMIGEKV